MQTNIDEGLFSADRNKKTLWGSSREDVQKKIDDHLDKFKEYNPKVSNIKTDKVGRFFAELSYQVNDKGNEETIVGRAKRGASKAKEYFDKNKDTIDKTKDVVKNVAKSVGKHSLEFIKNPKEKVKDVIDKNIPRENILTADSAFKLAQEQAKIVKAHPDVKFETKYRNKDGTWSIKYAALKISEPKQKPNTKSVTSKDRINNIQKALNSLSDNTLKNIENIINKE